MAEEKRDRKKAQHNGAKRTPAAGKKPAQSTPARTGRRSSELIRLEREQQVRRQLLLGGGAVLLFLILLVGIIIPAVRRHGARDVEETVQTPVEVVQTEQPVVSVVESVPEPVEEETPSGPQLALTTSDGEEIYFNQDPAYSEKLTILGTGDNIIHEQLFLNARKEDGSYDFTPYYERVKPFIEEADVATVNQEAPIASRIFEVSGYPRFNVPAVVADTLIDTGFDMLNFANNHILDQGVSGLIESLDYVTEKGYPYCGAYTDEDDRAMLHTVEANGFKVAFIGILDFTNQESDAADGKLIWTSSESRIESLIKNAKANADIVVVHAHWGDENEEYLTDGMVSLAQKMAEWGADLILGNHTHLLQQVRVLRNSEGKLVPVQYGGGNFISGQKERANLLSVLTTADFARNPQTGDVICTGLHCRPIVTHYTGDRNNVCIYPLADYTDELAAEHGVKDFEGETMTTSYLWDIVNKEIPSQFLQ
ncbi:MAG: CapA family protein [Lachnospiraceae bacterium]|nr:CapA family protein [Lachnospiraceae bacterium]